MTALCRTDEEYGGWIKQRVRKNPKELESLETEKNGQGGGERSGGATALYR